MGSNVSVRSDAVRNATGILLAAEGVFRNGGVDAPLEEIASRAGVSRATLYRHFPTREHLFAAILRKKVEALVTAAQERVDAPDPWQAVQEWIAEYETIGAGFRGMSHRLSDALFDEQSPVGELCAPMKRAFATLIDRAERAHEVRDDVSAADVLELIAALPRNSETGQAKPSQLSIIIDGLRPTTHQSQSTHSNQ